MAANEAKPQIGEPVGPGSRSQEEQMPSFEELMATPISEEEARIQLAECDIQLAQCQKERAMIEQRIADITWVRTVILRQVLNKPQEAEANG